jgi:nicotinamidase-related amidase
MRNKSIKKRNKNMAQPKTLSELVGLDGTPCSLSESALIMVDFQNTYRSGPMELAGVDEAMAEAEQVLARARKGGTPVIHIAHDAGPGSLYDVQAENGKIASQVAPLSGEPTVVKNFPNAFAKTDLHERLQDLNVGKLIVIGFMTHMCVSSTTRGAFDLGYRTTVVGNATATRDLPTADGQVLKAASLREATLAGLSDLVATVVKTANDLPA